MRLFQVLGLIIFLLLIAGCQQQAPYQSRAIEVFPPVKIQYAALFQIDQLSISPAFFQGQWTAMIFASASCEANCQHRLMLLNKLKKAQALLVIDDVANHIQLRALKKKYPNIAISMGSNASSIDNFMAQFDVDFIPANKKNDMVYLINPKPEFSYTLAIDNLKASDIDREVNVLKKSYLK